MRIQTLHSWDLTASEAFKLQSDLAISLDVSRGLDSWKTLAAADVSFDRFGTELYAGIVVIEAGSFEVVERVGISAPARFPYIPGLLSFREAPALIEAFSRLQTTPDVILCDGQGIAHPRRLGIASHLGLWLRLPTVGCAKSRLCGRYEEPGLTRGDRSPLTDRDEIVGAVLRTKAKVKPLFVSPGHLCNLDSSLDLVMQTTGKYRLPDPARLAHDYVNSVRRAAKGTPMTNE